MFNLTSYHYYSEAPSSVNSNKYRSVNIGSEEPLMGQNRLRKKYIHELTRYPDENTDFGVNFCGEYQTTLERLSFEKIDRLYACLINVLTPNCMNSDRNKIVNALLSISEDDWEPLLKQVCFIMPYGTRGHEIAWTTKILASIISVPYREQLVNTANRMFNFDTDTLKRGYILEALAKLNYDQLQALDRSKPVECSAFVQNSLPQVLKDEITETDKKPTLPKRSRLI